MNQSELAVHRGTGAYLQTDLKCAPSPRRILAEYSLRVRECLVSTDYADLAWIPPAKIKNL